MMHKRLTTRVLDILFHSDLQATRFTLALAEIVWAITLLWQGDSFARPTYTAMSHVMAEEAWGFVFLVTGIIQWTILYRGEFHSREACYFAAWNAALWIFVDVSMYMSVSPPPAAISGEAALAFAAAWVWIRSGLPQVTVGRRTNDAH